MTPGRARADTLPLPRARRLHRAQLLARRNARRDRTDIQGIRHAALPQQKRAAPLQMLLPRRCDALQAHHRRAAAPSAKSSRTTPFILLRLRGLDKESLINLLTLESPRDDGPLPIDEDDSEPWSAEAGEEPESVTGGAETPEEDESAAVSEEPPQPGESWFAAGDFHLRTARSRPHAPRRRARRNERLPPSGEANTPSARCSPPATNKPPSSRAKYSPGEKKKPVGRPRKLI